MRRSTVADCAIETLHSRFSHRRRLRARRISQASASTLAVDAGGTLRFHAAWGEVNNVNASDIGSPNTMVVTDSGSTIHASNGCVQVSAHEAQCAEAQFQDFRDRPRRRR